MPFILQHNDKTWWTGRKLSQDEKKRKVYKTKGLADNANRKIDGLQLQIVEVDELGELAITDEQRVSEIMAKFEREEKLTQFEQLIANDVRYLYVFEVIQVPPPDDETYNDWLKEYNQADKEIEENLKVRVDLMQGLTKAQIKEAGKLADLVYKKLTTQEEKTS